MRPLGERNVPDRYLPLGRERTLSGQWLEFRCEIRHSTGDFCTLVYEGMDLVGSPRFRPRFADTQSEVENSKRRRTRPLSRRMITIS